MPRKPRFTLPGVPQHVIQRGNNREPCFLNNGYPWGLIPNPSTCAFWHGVEDNIDAVLQRIEL